ncbi:MAG: protein translocase subunit SecD [Clostridia bacterium]|nr:protein translocase subunit SecD [Clostridia bacterium]
MKRKSLVTLCVTLVLVILIGVLAINGAQVGKYILKPVGQAISLGLDLRGGIYAVYLGDTTAENFDQQMDATVTIMRNRLTSAGYTEANITRQGSDRIRIEIPDVQDPNEVLNIVGTPAHLEFLDPEGNVIMEGKEIVKAAPMMGSNEEGGATMYYVDFELNEEGTKAFADATTAHVGETISIVLDDTVISAPTVNEPITGGKGMISGQFTQQEVINLANLIMSGALPLDIELIESSAVSATLGVEALDTSILAGIIGVIIIMIFMIAVYRLPGLVADIALSIYMLIVFYALALVPGVQLTLPGIAGIILGIGMAVDGNVIIFERFREELKGGRSIGMAAKRGYKNALSSIIDSNVTTIIAAVVLMYFGTGAIKGFAITLLIGVVTSMISSVFITRFLLNQVTNLGIKNAKLFTR